MNNFTIKQFLNKSGEWLKGTGPDNDIVISSRIRLARNLSDFKFSSILSQQETKKLIDLVSKAVRASNYLKNNQIINLDKLDEISRQLLLERHLKRF